MLLNEHQSKLWNGMFKTITDFREGEIQYNDFVGALEGALDAGEFQNEGLIEQWYEYWTPLEILRALKGNTVTFDDAKKYISDMESFLRSIHFED